MDLNSFLELMTVIATIIMAAAPLSKKALDKNKGNNLFKQLTWSGWVLVCCACIIIGFTFWKGEIATTEKRQDKIDAAIQHTQDSTRLAAVEEKLNGLGYIYDSSKKEFVFIGEQLAQLKDQAFETKREDKPLLGINEYTYVDIVNGSMQTVFSLKNYGTGLAKNIRFKMVSLAEKNGSFVINKPRESNISEATTIPPGGTQTSFFGYIPANNTYVDKQYLYIKVYYTNEQNTNAAPFRIIYLSPPPKLGNALVEVDKETYNRIKKELIKTKNW